LVSGSYEPTHVTCRVEVQAVSLTQQNITHEFAVISSVGQSWGWKKFHPAADLRTDDYLDEAGTLTMTFSVRPDSYYALWRWIRNGNERKQEKLKVARARANAKAAKKPKSPS
jgi:hypothetical protein